MKQEKSKPIHQQIIDSVGGEKRFKKLAGLEPKQETLEEVAEQFEYTDGIYGFKEGAKWMAKRMYSEEEVLDMLKFFTKDTRGDKPWVDADDEWFEQFKKK